MKADTAKKIIDVPTIQRAVLFSFEEEICFNPIHLKKQFFFLAVIHHHMNGINVNNKICIILLNIFCVNRFIFLYSCHKFFYLFLFAIRISIKAVQNTSRNDTMLSNIRIFCNFETRPIIIKSSEQVS